MNNFDVLDLWWLLAERLGHFDEPFDIKDCAFCVFLLISRNCVVTRDKENPGLIP